MSDSERIVVIKRPIEHYINLLNTDVPWTMSRWGDGEVMAVLQHYGEKNCDGCTFTPDLSNLLRAVLMANRPYDYGLLQIANREYGSALNTVCSQELHVSIRWVNGDLFLDKFLAGSLSAFFAALRRYRILYVGPEHCRKLATTGLFDYIDFIAPPPRDAILQRQQVVSEVEASIVENNIGCILWSSGLHAKVFIDDIWQITQGAVTQLDCGSMFDGLFSIPSRSYIRNGQVDFTKVLQQNLES